MTDNGDKSRDAVAGSSTMGLLHNKVDKMIRLMVETSENQKKMNKVPKICRTSRVFTKQTIKIVQVLQDLLKSGFTKAEVAAVTNSVGEEPGEAQGDRKRRRRDR